MRQQYRIMPSRTVAEDLVLGSLTYLYCTENQLH